MSQLYSMLLTSVAHESVDDVELYDILMESGQNNQRNNLTGLLVLKDGVFLETLEGERALVFETYERIMKDERHKDVVLLELERIEERQFDSFKMCFDSHLEKTHRQTGNYMNCAEAESLLSEIPKPTKAVVELLDMVC